VAKLFIEKGLITQDEFMEKIKAERATYSGDVAEGEVGVKGDANNIRTCRFSYSSR